MPEKTLPLVPVQAEVPPGYRAVLKIIRINLGYKNLGELLMVWIDDAVKAGCADPETALKAKEG